MAKLFEHKDLAGNIIKVGDCLAFSASTRYSARLGFGRVTRITSTRVAITEAVWEPEYREQPDGSSRLNLSGNSAKKVLEPSQSTVCWCR